MNRKYDVITALDTCVDILISCEDVRPVFGQAEQIIPDYAVSLGGSCGIFSCGSAKLGLKTLGLGVVGDDMFGRFVLDELRANQVDTSKIRTDAGLRTGVGFTLCTGDHDRAILTYTGSICAAGPELFTSELLANARHIHIGSYYLLNRLQQAYPSILREARKHGVTVSLDPNWDPSESWDGSIVELLPLVDIFLPNENEARYIMKTDDAHEAFHRLADIVPILAVKRGSRGSSVFAGQAEYTCGSVDVPVRDTVGAGDNFDAGFVYGFLQGLSPYECARIGSICGSYSTSAYGGISGQLQSADVRRLLGEQAICS